MVNKDILLRVLCHHTGFFLPSYKNRIVDFVLIWECAGQGEPAFWHVLRNVLAYTLIKTNLRNAEAVLI